MPRLLAALILTTLVPVLANAVDPAPMPRAKITIGVQAPDLKIQDAFGKVVDLAQLTEQGPVLVRLTCGCASCEKELAYVKYVIEAYKGQRVASLYVYRGADSDMAKFAKANRLDLHYIVDTDGKSWDVFQTKKVPVNFLIGKGGKIIAVAYGNDPKGLFADTIEEPADAAVDVKNRIEKK